MSWKTNVLLAFIGGLMLMAGLYQLEVLTILNFEVKDYWFELPFGIQVPWWFARDIFYTWIVIGSFMFGLAMHRPIKMLFENLGKLVCRRCFQS